MSCLFSSSPVGLQTMHRVTSQNQIHLQRGLGGVGGGEEGGGFYSCQFSIPTGVCNQPTYQFWPPTSHHLYISPHPIFVFSQPRSIRSRSSVVSEKKKSMPNHLLYISITFIIMMEVPFVSESLAVWFSMLRMSCEPRSVCARILSFTALRRRKKKMLRSTSSFSCPPRC